MLNFRYVILIFIGLLYNKSLIQCYFHDNNYNHNNHSINSNKKIAFLFMTRGPMPLEDVWRAFFNLHDEIYSNLYSIYIHPHSGYHFPPTSIFYQKVVDDHIEHVDWGGISQVRSIKHLVIEALKDPMNDRFCLMSESCIPLHSFTTFRNTLLSSNKSIVNACPWGGSYMYLSYTITILVYSQLYQTSYLLCIYICDRYGRRYKMERIINKSRLATKALEEKCYLVFINKITCDGICKCDR